jgi:hypothetical protein
MTRRSAQHATFAIKRRYAAPPAIIFNAFADPKAKARWSEGPAEWEKDERSVDFFESEGASAKAGPKAGLCTPSTASIKTSCLMNASATATACISTTSRCPSRDDRVQAAKAKAREWPSPNRLFSSTAMTMRALVSRAGVGSLASSPRRSRRPPERHRPSLFFDDAVMIFADQHINLAYVSCLKKLSEVGGIPSPRPYGALGRGMTHPHSIAPGAFRPLPCA